MVDGEEKLKHETFNKFLDLASNFIFNYTIRIQIDIKYKIALHMAPFAMLNHIITNPELDWSITWFQGKFISLILLPINTLTMVQLS